LTGATPTPETQPEFNPDPMAVITEPDVATDPTNELVAQIKASTEGHEYFGQVYRKEIVRDVGYLPSERLLIVEVDDVQDPDPSVAIIPLKLVDVVEDEFGIGEPAIFFRCDPACITIAFATVSEAKDMLSEGRTDDLFEPEQRSEFGFGCDLVRCAGIENALDQLVEFASRP
jgi:hypothetical protein